MKVTYNREKLLHAFQMAASVAPARSTKDILKNIKLDTTSDTATVMGTDLDIGIRIDVPGFEIEVPGSAVLPIDRFGLILRESSDERLRLESDGNKTTVCGDRSEFRLPSANPDEFPPIVAFEEENYHELPARLFREIVRRTVFATDNESSRYALGGVLLELEAEKITAVATDGRRLAQQEGAAKVSGGHTGGDTMTIVPTRAMQVLERALADNDGEIQLAAHDNSILVRSERTTVYSRLVEGRYPKWRDVFPSGESAVKIEVAPGPFHAAVRQAAIVTDKEHRGIDFSFGDGQVMLTGRGAELGDARVDFPISYDGPTIPVTLDPRFVGDFLRVLDPEQTIQVELIDEKNAVVCRTDDGYGYVIMPLARDKKPKKS